MYKEKSLTSNIFTVLSANMIVAIVGFIGSFIFPRILSIEAYATYHTFTLYLTYITITTLGFPSGMVVNYAGKDYYTINQGHYKSETILLAIILVFFTIIFALGSIFFQSKMMSYVAISIIPVGVVGSYKALLQSWSRFAAFRHICAILALSIPTSAVVFYLITGDLPAEIYIGIYILINWVITLCICLEVNNKTRGIKAEKLLSYRNLQTEKIGLALLVGNYVNTLFVSVDKQFIKWFYGNNEFAFYSFGMSMQALMTVFITSIAQPLFPAMAQEKIRDEDYSNIKSVLLVFGSFSGCAYFILSIVVKNFIPKYISSLSVISIYFVVFPAMAVINCLYINLYKIKNMMKIYMTTLIGILFVAIFLNIVFVMLYKDYTGVAIATTITYYLWFILGIKQFSFIKLTIRDCGYLVGFFLIFFTLTRLLNDFIGLLIYLMLIIILVFIFYRTEFSLYLYLIGRRFKK